jgi:Cu2+-exporting ATPase
LINGVGVISTVTGAPGPPQSTAACCNPRLTIISWDRGLAGIRELLLVAAPRRATARIVIGFAIAYNLVAVTVSMAGRMNPVLAAVLMPASSVVALALVAMGLRER